MPFLTDDPLPQRSQQSPLTPLLLAPGHQRGSRRHLSYVKCLLGAFVQLTYDGVARDTFLDNTDVRYAHQTEITKTSVVLGVDVNNNPTVQDVWNTTPAWAYPFAASGLALTPAAAP
jgi:hypothetical protein